MKSDGKQKYKKKFDYNKCALETELINFIEYIKLLNPDDLKTFDDFSELILDELLNPKKVEG